MVAELPKKAATRVYIPRLRPPASLRATSSSTGGSDPGFFQSTSSSLGLRACETVYAPFSSRVSVSQSPTALQKASPTGLQSQLSWGLVLLVQDLWEPNVGPGFLTPWWEPLQLWLPSNLWVRVGGLSIPLLHPFLLYTVSFQVVLNKCCFENSCNFGGLWEEMSSGSSSSTILATPH